MSGIFALPTASVPLALATSSQPSSSTAIALFAGLTRKWQAGVIDNFIPRISDFELSSQLKDRIEALRDESTDLEMHLMIQMARHERELIASIEATVPANEFIWDDSLSPQDLPSRIQATVFGTPEDYTRLLNSRRKTLKSDNPILHLFKLERAFVSAQKRDVARKNLEQIIQKAREVLRTGTYPPDDILLIIYDVIKKFGYQIVTEDEKSEQTDAEDLSHIFIQNLIEKKLDCDDLAFIYLTLGHELQWPIVLGFLHDHMVAIWNHGAINLVLDFGEVHQIRFYEREVKGMPITELTDEQIEGFFHFNQASVFHHGPEDTRNLESALTSYNEAIETYHLNIPIAYLNRGAVLLDMNRFKAAIVDFDEAIRLNPNLAEAYFNRGVAHDELGHSKAAQANFNKARELGLDVDEALKE